MAEPIPHGPPSAPAADADLRDAFFDTLYAVAAADPSVMVLTDDQGAFGLERLKKDLPGQYYNVGIAEQNLVLVGAGLALAGKRPFLYGISTFMTMRCYEQIRLDLACMNLPVTLIGSGPGFTYGSDGPTHHATHDLALLRGLPEMTILSPADAVSTAAAARLAAKTTGPMYVRLEKGVLPGLYAPDHDFATGFHRVRPGSDLTLVATGFMVHRALAVAEELAGHSVSAGVIDVYRPHPVSGDQFGRALAGAPTLVTIEETCRTGGLGSLVAETVADAGLNLPLMRLAAPDGPIYKYGDRDWLHTLCGLDAAALTKAVLAWLGQDRTTR